MMDRSIYEQFIARAIAVLEADGRFLGLAAGGSWMDGSLDPFSDLDLVIVSESGSEPDVTADRARIAGAMGSLLSAFTGEHVGEPRLVICLFDAPLLHVDMKF